MALRPPFPPPKCPHTPPEEEVSNSDDEIAACLGRVAHWGASVLQEKAPLGRGLKSRRFTRTNSKRVSLLWPFHGRWRAQEKAPLRAGLSFGWVSSHAEGVLPQEDNSGRAELFRGIRLYGVRLKGKAPAS